MDPFQPAGRLVRQATHQQSPSGPHDLPVEPGLGADIPARLSYGALSRSCHSCDSQILYADHVEPASKIRRDFLGPVLARVGLLGLQSGHGQLDPLTTFRPSHCPRQPALKMAEPAPPCGTEPGHSEHLACGQRRADDHAPVDADDFTVAWRGDGFRERCECDMPALGAVHGDPVGGRLRNGTGPSEPYPSSLGDPHFTNLPAEPMHLPRLDSDDPEPFIVPGFAPRGLAVRAREEIRHRLGEVPQRLLLHHLTAGPQPPILGTSLGKLPALVQVSRRAATPGVPPQLLLDREVSIRSGRARSDPAALLPGSLWAQGDNVTLKHFIENCPHSGGGEAVCRP